MGDENNMWLWLIGGAVLAYLLYQTSSVAAASSTTTVSYHKLNPDGSVGTFSGATPGQYPVCSPEQGYPVLPCQIGGTSESY